MSDTVRVRFAPSPTGFLHIGGARTALFNWLFARAQSGRFLLRIEDTDRERSLPEYTEDILESLRWLGLDWDEEPVFQSKRGIRYAELVAELFSKNLAYRCQCSKEELEALRAACVVAKKPFRYPGTCRDKKLDSGVIRLKMPEEGETALDDLIRGKIVFPNSDLDDWVICRSDESPTYNFVVVADDHDQGITHVLRGDDHINNTPKQIQVYKAFGWKVPQFAHLPMIMGADRAKLSKRHGAASTLEYRKMGYLPETMINFLVRLGWSHGDQEIFTIEELKKYFSLDHVGKSSAIFNVDKLDWVSGQQLQSKSPGDMDDYLAKFFVEQYSPYKTLEKEKRLRAISAIQGKTKKIPELIEQMDCLFGPDPVHNTADLNADQKQEMKDLLSQLAPLLEDSDFTVEKLEKDIRGYVKEKGLKFGPMAHALRFAVTGGRVSPGLFEMLSLMGREKVLRLAKAARESLNK